jgi:hypothetical protein
VQQGWEMLLIDIDRRQRRIEGMLYRILQKENIIMADLTNITAAVANETTVEDSAVVLIQNLAAAVTAAGTDPAALAALTDQLNSEATSLAAAVTANTPAASS